MACVGERKAAAGVSGGRRALVAGCVEGRGAAMPPAVGIGQPVRGGRVEPRGGLGVPRADCPKPV